MRRLLFALALVTSACADDPPDLAVVAAPLDACPQLPLAAPAGGRIIVAQCRAATATMPAHLNVMGCLDCDGAVYSDATGLVTNGANLPRIPTTWVLRIGADWNGRVVARINGGNLTHMVNPLAQVQLQKLGFATLTLNHPLPGHPQVPLDYPHFRAGELAEAYTRTGRVVRDYLDEGFGTVEQLYGFGFSRGLGAGFGGILDDPDSPFDGYVIGGFGGGYQTRLELQQRIWASAAQQQPCLHLPTEISGMTRVQADRLLAADVRLADPGYTGSPLEYDAPERPGDVADNWQALAIGADLQRPTIELHGLRDRLAPALLTLHHAVRVATAGRGDLYRLYFIKTGGHGTAIVPIAQPKWPDELDRDATLHLDTWVRTGVWPADDAVTEILPSAGVAGRTQVSCQALLPEASWDAPGCQDDPYKWDKHELQACPDPDHPKVRSCAPWSCFFGVRDGP